MLERILVASDLSHRSEIAIARAAELARRFGARLHLLHVVEQDQPDSYVSSEIRQTEDALALEAGHLKDQFGIDLAVHVVPGDPFEMIGDFAANINADLIVMGRHRRRPLRDLFIGTTAERVIWRGTHPVLMVKGEGAGRYDRIGIALDCSEPSGAALKLAYSSGLLEDAQVSIVHARLPFAKTMLAAHANREAIEQHVSSEMRIARAELTNFLRENDAGDLTSRIYLEEGEPIAVLSSFIDRSAPDLLVMGTHGRQGLGRLVLGSVAEEALRTLEVDILAVPV